MTLSKKGLRTLAYNGHSYGWKIRQKPTYCQGVYQQDMTIAIQLMECESPKVLHVTLNIDRPDNWVAPHQTQIRPQTIREVIDRAILDGWVSDAGGKAYEINHSIVKHS